MMKEYADLEIMQMLGRAGRPQFDRDALAVIMTRQEKSSRYEKMVSGQETIESWQVTMNNCSGNFANSRKAFT